VLWLTPGSVYDNLLALRHKHDEFFHVRLAALNDGPEVFRLLKRDMAKDICAFLVLDDMETNLETICFRTERIEVPGCILDTFDEVAQPTSQIEHVLEIANSEAKTRHYENCLQEERSAALELGGLELMMMMNVYILT
jgi:hypothetical protein